MKAQHLLEDMCFKNHGELFHINSITGLINITYIKDQDAETIRDIGIFKESWDDQYYIFKQISLEQFFKEIFVG